MNYTQLHPPLYQRSVHRFSEVTVHSFHRQDLPAAPWVPDAFRALSSRSLSPIPPIPTHRPDQSPFNPQQVLCLLQNCFKPRPFSPAQGCCDADPSKPQDPQPPAPHTGGPLSSGSITAQVRELGPGPAASVRGPVQAQHMSRTPDADI